jgi:hypothetical protein
MTPPTTLTTPTTTATRTTTATATKRKSQQAVMWNMLRKQL